MAANDTVKVKVTADASQFKKEMRKVDDTLKKTQERASKTGGAVSGLGSALGGALPPQVGAGVSALGNLLDVVIAGGPLALGIAGIVAGLGFMAKKFFDVREAAKKAADAARKEFDAIRREYEATIRALEVAKRGEEAVKQEELSKKLADTDKKRWEIEERRVAVQAKLQHIEMLRREGETVSLSLEKSLNEELERYNKQLLEVGAAEKELEATQKTRIKTKRVLNEQEEKGNEVARKAPRTDPWEELVFNSGSDLPRIQREQIERMNELAEDERWAKRDFWEEQFQEVERRKEAEREILQMQLDAVMELEARRAAALEEFRSQAESEIGAVAGFSAGVAAQQGRLWGEMFAAQEAGNRSLMANLNRQQADHWSFVGAQILDMLSARAIGEGTIIAAKGAAAVAEGINIPGGLAMLGVGGSLIAAGVGGTITSGAWSGYVSASGRSGAASAPVAASAPTSGAGAVGGGTVQETRIVNYNFYGPAFGMAEDDTARTIVGLHARGSRLEGRG